MKTKQSTGDWVNLLCYVGDIFSRPTLNNLTGGYENWEYRHRRILRLPPLERLGLVERVPSMVDARLYRLTASGRSAAAGGRDPEAHWRRKWDKRWRLALFDVPQGRNALRARLRRYLQSHRFGCLQKSVWITPDTIEDLKQTIAGDTINAKCLIFMEAQPCAEETEEDIVSAAWDFRNINKGYQKYLDLMTDLAAHNESKPLKFPPRALVDKEQNGWLDAVRIDPLLPRVLWPAEYLGEKAWQARQAWRAKLRRQSS
jgi:phenylacetic acid degradation operon negative regulatory protein